MARMLARDNAIGPGGVDCRYCCGAQPTSTARAREKRAWRAEAEAEARADLWDAYYSDAYRHMHEDSGCDHETSDRAAREWADRKVSALG